MSNPWFPMYAPDFLTSTMSMAPEVVGAYTRLLCYAWMNGSIPGDMASLQRITGGITQEGWDEIRARLIPYGDRDGDRVQNWVHPRMERERKRTDTIRRARQEAANNTNRKRQDGDRTADRDGDRSGDRDADRPYPQPQPQVTPPKPPPQAGGARRLRRRDVESPLQDPTWTPF